MRILLGILGLAVILNLFSWLVFGVTQGGDALHGKIEDGKYYLGDHARYTEVSARKYVKLIIIGAQPLLEAALGTNFARLLTLYGNPGSSYEIDYATNLLNPKWQNSWRVPMTNFSRVFAANAVLPQVFYRAFEFFAEPPILELNSSVPSNLVLLVYGQKSSNYAIISGTNLQGTSTWSSIAGFTLTNSFQFINVGPATNRMQFFRVKEQ